MHRELETLFVDIDRDDDVKLAVLTGTGRAFSAGGDLDWLLELSADPAASARTIAGDRRIQNALLGMETPIIAKVNGPAVGLGCSIALFCDIVIATPDAIFSDPHVSVGLVAGDGGALLWPQLIGFARARRYLLTGDAITGTDAAAMGLITETADAGELDAVVTRGVNGCSRSRSTRCGGPRCRSTPASKSSPMPCSTVRPVSRTSRRSCPLTARSSKRCNAGRESRAKPIVAYLSKDAAGTRLRVAARGRQRERFDDL